MISLIAALVISPQADLLESFSYEWQYQLEKYQLNCTVVQGKKTGEIEVEFSRDAQVLWQKTCTIEEPNEVPTEAVILRAATGSSDRVLIIDIERNSWRASYILLCTRSAGHDFVFSYRNSRANVIEFQRDTFGMVNMMTTYDKYITGKDKRVKQNGEILDRWEQVKTYKLTAKGFQTYSTKYRLVNVTGGGIPEKNFMWRTDWEKR